MPPGFAGRRLRAVVLPPIAWHPARAGHVAGSGPDPLALERRLAERGVDITVIDPGRAPANPLAGRGTLLASIDPLRALGVLAAHRDADIVVSVFEGAALPLVLLRRLAGFRVPVVLWDLGLTEHWPMRERILDLVVRRADGVFVLGASQLGYIAGRWGRRDGVELLGHSIDTEFFAPAPFEPEGPILSVGDDAGRDFGSLIAAVDGIGARLVIKSKSLAAAGLPPNVTLRGDRIDHRALRALYAGSRFVVVPLHPTLNASGVSTILEAASMGRALIVSDNPAIRDFVVPDETCLVVPCGDRAALRAAIGRLLAEPETCARLGANARRFAERTVSIGVFAERFAGVLRRYARASAAS